MTDESRERALEKAGRLSAALDAVTTELGELKRALLRSKRFTRMLAWSLVADVVLTVALAIVTGITLTAYSNAAAANRQAEGAYRQAVHAFASNQALCEASNVARHQQIGVWYELLGDLGKPRTGQARRVEDGFKVYLRRIFAPRDCPALGRKA